MLDEERLIQILGALPVKHRVAFAASCCERLLPNYQAFALLEHSDDPHLLDRVLEEVWDSLHGESLSETRVRELEQTIHSVLSHIKSEGFIFASMAWRAAGAVVYALNCCIDGDPKWAAFTARLTVETIDLYLFVVNTPYLASRKLNGTPEQRLEQDALFDKWVEQAPLMLDELEKQRQDLEALRSIEELTPSFINSFQQSSRVRGLQPLARGLVELPKDKS